MYNKAQPHAAMLHTCDDNFAPDFGISQLFIARFSNGLQHSDGHSRDFPVIDDVQLSSKYFS